MRQFFFAAAPTTRPIHSIGDVDSNFQDRAKVAKRTYDDAMAVAADERLQGLRLLQDRAVKAEDLDQAIAINSKLTELKNNAADDEVGPEILARRKFESRICGSKWHDVEYAEGWSIKKDGTVLRTDGSVGEWAAINSNTIAVRLSVNGVETMDKWKFDDELKSFHVVHGRMNDPQWNGQRSE